MNRCTYKFGAAKLVASSRRWTRCHGQTLRVHLVHCVIYWIKCARPNRAYIQIVETATFIWSDIRDPCETELTLRKHISDRLRVPWVHRNRQLCWWDIICPFDMTEVLKISNDWFSKLAKSNQIATFNNFKLYKFHLNLIKLGQNYPKSCDHPAQNEDYECKLLRRTQTFQSEKTNLNPKSLNMFLKEPVWISPGWTLGTAGPCSLSLVPSSLSQTRSPYI